MIRKGEEKDIPDIVRMAEEFWQHTQFDEEYDPETVAGMANLCIEQGLMAVYVSGSGAVRGFACGIKGGLLANASVPQGSEVAWWIDPECRSGAGIKLLKFIEGLARDAGLKYWSMVFMESSMPDVIEKIYQGMGYNKAETIYTKVL